MRLYTICVPVYYYAHIEAETPKEAMQKLKELSLNDLDREPTTQDIFEDADIIGYDEM